MTTFAFPYVSYLSYGINLRTACRHLTQPSLMGVARIEERKRSALDGQISLPSRPPLNLPLMFPIVNIKKGVSTEPSLSLWVYCTEEKATKVY